jgi:glyoxylase-like metal-dependent hydrolase (beta-lactamase superfamily II)
MRLRWLWIPVALAALVAPAYWALLLHSPAPTTPFPLDIARIRALGDSIAGARATAIRYERVMSSPFYEAAQVAGDPWRPVMQDVFAYQLAFPGRTIVVDAAMDRGQIWPQFLLGTYDDAAWQRLCTALGRATQVVVTHEHADHIGGLFAQPRLRDIRRSVMLTAEQLANTRGMYPVAVPAGFADGYEPLQYEGLVGIAPGVVLIKAPGHTPGSQMVYVKRADGREVIFLGDVSWRMRNIELVRERPLLLTAIVGEDRPSVLGQFQALHALGKAERGIALVPGHEGAVVQALVANGLLQPGFE